MVVHCSVLTRRLRPSTSTVLVADLQVTSSVLVVIPLDPDSDVPAVPVLPAGLDVAVAVPDSEAVRTPRGELPPIGAVDPFAYGDVQGRRARCAAGRLGSEPNADRAALRGRQPLGRAPVGDDDEVGRVHAGNRQLSHGHRR